MKICIRCNKSKDIDDFFINKLSKDKHGSFCKDCDKLKTKEYRLNRYGISKIEHKNLSIFQDYRCAICSKREIYKELSIDHCHITGKVRGLLCTKCNMGLGLFEDNTDLLILAATYLEESRK